MFGEVQHLRFLFAVVRMAIRHKYEGAGPQVKKMVRKIHLLSSRHPLSQLLVFSLSERTVLYCYLFSHYILPLGILFSSSAIEHGHDD